MRFNESGYRYRATIFHICIEHFLTCTYVNSDVAHLFILENIFKIISKPINYLIVLKRQRFRVAINEL
jgi:hypothetical protein